MCLSPALSPFPLNFLLYTSYACLLRDVCILWQKKKKKTETIQNRTEKTNIARTIERLHERFVAAKINGPSSYGVISGNKFCVEWLPSALLRSLWRWSIVSSAWLLASGTQIHSVAQWPMLYSIQIGGCNGMSEGVFCVYGKLGSMASLNAYDPHVQRSLTRTKLFCEDLT